MFVKIGDVLFNIDHIREIEKGYNENAHPCLAVWLKDGARRHFLAIEQLVDAELLRLEDLLVQPSSAKQKNNTTGRKIQGDDLELPQVVENAIENYGAACQQHLTASKQLSSTEQYTQQKEAIASTLEALRQAILAFATNTINETP